MTRRLTILFMVIITLSLYAGDDDTGPMRIEIAANAEVFSLIPCGDKGVMVFYETANQIDQQNKSWFFIFYDTQFQSLWSVNILVFVDFLFADAYRDENILYFAFQKAGRSKANEYNFQFMEMDIDEGSFITYNMFIPDRADLASFQVFDGKMFAGFNYWKEEALLLIRDLKSGEEKAVIFSENPSFIHDIKIEKESMQVMVAVTVYLSRRESALYLNSYEFDGNLILSNQIVPTQSSEKLLNAQMHLVSANEFYVMGSYNNLNGRATRSDDVQRGEQSEGFYVTTFEAGKQKSINFYKLLDFKNITQILNNQQLASATGALKRQTRRGRELSLNYDFLIHDLIVHKDEFIMPADAYYPEYRQVTTMSYDFYGRPMPYYYTVFEGYRFFNAFAVSFNKDGQLNWSNGMKIWDIKSMRLERKTAFFIDGNDMVLFYNYDGKITSKMIDGYNDIGADENIRIATRYAGDVQLESSQGMIAHWYGDYFLAYGYQTLRNTMIDGGNRRKVFYVNKIMFD